MRRKNKFKLFLKLYFLRGIIPGIYALISLEINDDTPYKLVYYGLGDLAAVLILSLPLFFIINFFAFAFQSTILPLFRGDWIEKVIIIVVIILVSIRGYLNGHLIDILPSFLLAMGYALVTVLLEERMVKR